MRSDVTIVTGCLVLAISILGWLYDSPNIIGNDYPVYQLRYAQIYRFYTSLGLNPMWYPHLELGMPAGGLGMAQPFHLPGWLAAQIPTYWDGGGLRVIAVKHILLCAISHFTLFFGLTRFGSLKRWLAFVLAFLLVYQLRTLDAIRYGTFNDAYCYLLVSAVAGVHFLRSGSNLALVLTCVSLQLILTSGYQPIISYGLFAFVLVLPILIRDILKGTIWIKRLPALMLTSIVAFLLSAPSWLPFFDFLSLNSQRVQATNIEWADRYGIVTDQTFPLNIMGYVYNLVSPFLAGVHAAFGGSILYAWVLLSIFIFLLISIRINIIPLIIFVVIFLYLAGGQGGLYPVLYDSFPTIRYSRIPGRMGIMIPAVILILLCRIVPQTHNSPKLQATAWRSMATASALLFLINVGMAIYFIRAFNPATFFSNDSIPIRLNFSNWQPSTVLAWYLNSAFSLLTLFIYTRRNAHGLRSNNTLRNPRILVPCVILVCSLSLAQTSYLFRYGSWVDARWGNTTYSEFTKVNHLPLYSDYPLIGTTVLGIGYEAAVVPADNFYQLSGSANVTPCLYPIREGGRSPSNIVLPFYLTSVVLCADSLMDGFTSIDSTTCAPHGAVIAHLGSELCALGDAGRAGGVELLRRMNSASQLYKLTPNGLAMSVNTPSEAVLVTPYPYVPGWVAFLNGASIKIHEVNGGMIGILIPPGASKVEIRFRSNRYLYSYLIFAMTLPLVLSAIISRKFPTASIKLKVVLITGSIACGVLVWLYWKQGVERSEEMMILLNNNYSELLDQQDRRWAEDPSISKKEKSAPLN